MSEDLKISGDLMPGASLVTDRYGNQICVADLGDMYSPPFPLVHDTDYMATLKRVREMEVNDGDILLCSFPKTGTHWNTEIIYMLVAGKVVYNTDGMGARLLEIKATPINIEGVDTRIFNTHLNSRYVPKQAFEKKVKVVVCNRNPKDTIVSFYNHFKRHVPPLGWPGTFEHWYHWIMDTGGYFGGPLTYYSEWQDTMDDNPGTEIFMSMFEDLKADPVTSIMKLNEFLGLGRSREFCEQVADACHFDKLKVKVDEHMAQSVKNTFQEGKQAFFQKGDTGDWKNWFTVAMNEHFDAEFKKRMANFRTEYKFTL